MKQFYKMLGHDVISNGLGIYFSRHAWQNTELKDFVGAMEESYSVHGNNALGLDFNIWEWTDQWLSSSGVNILEPVLSYSENNILTSI